MKKTSMPHPVKSLRYIKYHSMASPRPIYIPSNSIRYNCQKICGWLMRLKTMLEIRKKAKFMEMINIIYKLFKYLTNHRKKTNRVVAFSHIFISNILKYWDHRWDLPTIWKTRFCQTQWRVQLVYAEVQTHSSSEPPQEYNEDQMPLMNQGWLWPFEQTWELQEYGALLD